MNPFELNPFGLLTFIVAPAILTNASSVMALGTSNRFARTVDRVRKLSALLENKQSDPDPETAARNSFGRNLVRDANAGREVCGL